MAAPRTDSVMCHISLVILIILQGKCIFGYNTATMATLRTTQLSNSNHLVRPNGTVHVKLQLNLLSINDLNVKEQKLTSAGWITLEWLDSRFSWTPGSNDDINYFYALESEVWRPEVIVDNSLENLGILSDENILFRIKHDGKVYWEVPRIFVTHCEVDVTYFPFDTQQCSIEITSWAYTKDELVMEHLATAINFEDFKENGEWSITGSKLLTHEMTEHIGSSQEVFSQLDFVISMNRRATFYILNTLLPVILSSYLSLTVFLLPADSGEKVSYSLTVLLALAVLLTLIADMMPSTSLHVAVLGMYLAVILFIATVSVLMTVLVLRLFVKPETERKPKCLLKFISGIQAVICWKGCCFERGGDLSAIVVNENLDISKVKKITPLTQNRDPESTKSVGSSASVHKQQNITWKEISEILDRFFFWLFFVVVTLITIICLSVMSGHKDRPSTYNFSRIKCKGTDTEFPGTIPPSTRISGSVCLQRELSQSGATGFQPTPTKFVNRRLKPTFENINWTSRDKS